MPISEKRNTQIQNILATAGHSALPRLLLQQTVALLLVLLVTACAGQHKPETLILDNRDANGKFTRIYTRAAMLPADKKHPDASSVLMFLTNKDRQGMLMLSSSKSIAALSRMSLSIDGEAIPLQGLEKFNQNSRKRFKHGFFYPVSLPVLQKLASAKEAILTIERKGTYKSVISNSVKDRLSLLLVNHEYVTRGKQWAKTSQELSTDADGWLKQLTIYKFDRSHYGEDLVDIAVQHAPIL